MKRIVTVVYFAYDFPDDEGYPLDNLAVPAPSNDFGVVNAERIGSAMDFYFDDQSVATIVHHAVYDVVS